MKFKEEKEKKKKKDEKAVYIKHFCYFYTIKQTSEMLQ